MSTEAIKACNTSNFYIFVTTVFLRTNGKVSDLKYCFSEERGRLIFGQLNINVKEMDVKSNSKN
jgi:hypothetical protein